MHQPTPTIVPLTSPDVSLATVGGKGRALAQLAVAGLPVPPGFVVTTSVYQGFVEEHGLQDSILQHAAEAALEKPDTIARASQRIQSLFAAGSLSADKAAAIERACASLGKTDVPVAIRSSATAEDLPDQSFAGQQDTFLNVCGTAEVLTAIRRCWASLWSPRAISYRLKMEIDQRSVAMGVIVQRMVPADSSGIVFTANPATGDRSELVVNASFGLGEAIVGGDVTPDTFILERDSLEIKETQLGGKEHMVVANDQEALGQGTLLLPVPEAQQQLPSLSPVMLRELGALSLRAEAVFGGQPQDIEWAVSLEKVWLLQSRPITHLPPEPPPDVAWDPPSVGSILIRRQVVENMPAPLSPLFDELYLRIGLDQAIDQFLLDYNFRIELEDFIDRPFFVTVNGFAYCRGSYDFPWRLLWTFPHLLYSYIKMAFKLLKNFEGHWRDEALPSYLATIRQWEAVDRERASDHQLFSGVRELAIADANYWFAVSIMVAGAKVTDGLLDYSLQSWFGSGKLRSGMYLRGFPSKTIEAQVALESIATLILRDDGLSELVRAAPADDLLAALSGNSQGAPVLEELDQLFDRYGHQVYNLDFAEPTQVENPAAVLLSLQALVRQGQFDTKARQSQLVRERDALIQRTTSLLGGVRRWLFRKYLKWAQTYGPCREEALFYMGAAWLTLRRMALELGKRLAAIGTLTRPEDIFFLECAEVAEACAARDEGRELKDIGHRAAERRALREARRRLHPPGIIPEGSRWTFGPFDMTVWETQRRNADDTDELSGFAVSPGSVTGIATVVMSPDDFPHMKPDSILVCPTTTPAWTPLFAQAVGLVTDVGGILAHGSIVAREYGIPAVMGIGNATQRIASGQRIRVDGDAGTVTLLD